MLDRAPFVEDQRQVVAVVEVVVFLLEDTVAVGVGPAFDEPIEGVVDVLHLHRHVGEEEALLLQNPREAIAVVPGVLGRGAAGDRRAAGEAPLGVSGPANYATTARKTTIGHALLLLVRVGSEWHEAEVRVAASAG